MAREELSKGEVEALVNELETKLSRLRALYEQYFLGIERVPPSTARKDVVRLIHRLESVYIRNTALKFKIRSLVQRFNSYKTYWNRTERQIEEGTYERDIRRAKRNQQRRERRQRRKRDDDVVELDIELEAIDLEAMQRELEEMDAAGAFDAYERPSGASDAADDSDRERVKQERLAEIRAQLNGDGNERVAASVADSPARSQASAPPPAPAGSEADGQDSDRRAKLEKIRQRLLKRKAKTGRAPAASEDLPSGGANIDQLRKLREAKTRLEQEKRARTNAGASSSRPSGGSGGSDDRQIYDKLIEAKRRCNESTAGLSYENVSKSMAKQKEQLRRSRGARDVEFKVVIKDGRAFLKPVPK